jgi:hypothetical protein
MLDFFESPLKNYALLKKYRRVIIVQNHTTLKVYVKITTLVRHCKMTDKEICGLK